MLRNALCPPRAWLSLRLPLCCLGAAPAAACWLWGGLPRLWLVLWEGGHPHHVCCLVPGEVGGFVTCGTLL